MELIEDESQWKQFLRHHGYLLHHQIGYGSFGDVFCVTPSSINEESQPTKYALKRLVTRRNILDDEYVMMEIHSLLRLQHQNIVSLHEVFLNKSVACIVMELAPLGNIEMLFKNSKTSIITKSFVTASFGQILSAVEYCHRLSLAHRDINPTNVLVCSHSLVKLADFGLCFQCRDDVTGDWRLCADYLGQEKYTAPEVKRCEPFLALPADVWSLGCLLSYLATNCRCFKMDRLTHCPRSTDQNSKCDNNRTEIKRSVPTNIKVNFNANHASRGYSCQENSETGEDMIHQYIQKLCKHSPNKRPSVDEAIHDWEEIHHDINRDDRNQNDSDILVSTTISREE